MDSILFALQKVVLMALFPVPVALILGVSGLILCQRRGLAIALVASGLTCLTAASLPVTGLALIHTLEARAGSYADPAALSAKGVRFVVVLSGGFNEGDLRPIDRIGSSAIRLVEGIRLWRGIPGCKLVVTGGRIPGLSEDMSIARALAEVSMELAVPKEALILEDRSWTTEDQAEFIKPIVGKEPFALVTSAYHMPRSVMLCRLKGLDPLPAPVDFTTKVFRFNYNTLIPRSEGLWMTEITEKEYLAMWGQMLKYRVWPKK
jgi:uncharacterized SAM-binding protein YcdF (DUF218 family)